MIIFPEAMLTAETIQKLHDLGYRYEDWLKVAIDDQEKEERLYGENFYYNAEPER